MKERERRERGERNVLIGENEREKEERGSRERGKGKRKKD